MSEERLDMETGASMTNPNVVAGVNLDDITKAEKSMENIRKVPAGYAEVRLSTLGKVGAPEVFYVRNFLPEDLMALGLADETSTPIKLIDILDSMIWNEPGTPEEEKISVKNFHEKEVVELLLYILEVYYSPVFPDQTWDLTEDDYEFLAEKYGKGSEEYTKRIRAIEEGEWKPKFDLDISKDLDYYEIGDDPDFGTEAEAETVLPNGEHFTASFSLPKFGDFIQLKFFIEEIFAKEDRKFQRIGEIIKFRRDAKKKMEEEGKYIDLSRIPYVPENEEREFDEYENRKSVFAITATKALYLQSFNGKDLSKMSLKEKLKYAQDPRLDYGLFNQVQEAFDNLKFGYKEEVTVLDPIQEKVVTRKYNFQIIDLLQAIQDRRNSKTNVVIKRK